ncbi:MAG: hypothetical protein M3N43_05890, partial [Actinomycetota bacterium]|nr:hypothetical protein [Actinomycetota bacterium]
MLLASDGRRDFSRTAVARAAALAGSDPVGVVRIAKIFGSSFGVPHPGLLPTKQELAEHRGHVDRAIRGLRKSQVQADGQVAATRRASRKLAEIAQLRRVRAIVIDETEASGWRRVIEGDVGSELRKKLRHTVIDVEIVPA